MKNIFEELVEILKSDESYFDNGVLNKNKIVEQAFAVDGSLIKWLLSNEKTKKHFFTDVDGVLVFDKVKFQQVVNNKQFLPGSYTIFKNKIGLSANNSDLLTAREDVSLVFPHKDCVLEGGQTKEDQKRDEVFYNEILSPDEIDTLLAPKVFTNFKKFDKDGEHKVDKIDIEKDNLIIKGNNLLAMSSLLERYRGKVKCIYIDPPYNTGSDSFGYNDRFNHASWLVFMRNRLKLAKELLSNDGVIWVHCDNNEFANLKILMDEIYNLNYQTTITNCCTPNGRDYGNFAITNDFIHVYAKNNITVKLFKQDEKDLSKYNKKDGIGVYYLHPLFNSNSNFNSDNRPNLYYPFYVNPIINTEGFYDISIKNKDNWVEVFPPISKTDGTQFVWRWGKDLALENLNIEIVGVKLKNGEFRIVQKMRSNKKLPRTIWSETTFSNRHGTEQLQKLFNGKLFAYPKSEELIENILKISTIKNDLVMDFNLGSGTTAAVAHKMGRRYIGIEQMDYIDNVTTERLKKVIAGEQGGISKEVNWQGGGDFVYCELKELNQKYVDMIESANDDNSLVQLWNIMQENAFLSYKVDVKQINANITDFKLLSIEDKKQFLMEVLDKNLLYVNYSDMLDEELNVSEEDKKLNTNFYEV